MQFVPTAPLQCSWHELDVVVTTGAAAEEYCNVLESQNSGVHFLKWIVLAGALVALLLKVMFWCMCTACCTCWCCCARPGCFERISSACSRGCFHWWSRLITCCGCGWCGPPPDVQCWSCRPTCPPSNMQSIGLNQAGEVSASLLLLGGAVVLLVLL